MDHFEPPEQHKVQDRIGKRLLALAADISEKLDLDEPILISRKGHVSIEDVLGSIDAALEANDE